MMTTTNNDVKLHVFEAAGLGRAPYKFLRMDVMRGPIRRIENGVEVQIGAPGQPMGSCQYCSTGILYAFWLRSADGKEFYVGSDCIMKSGDAGLRRVIDPLIKQMQKEQRDARAKMTLEQALAVLPLVRDALKQERHPFGFGNKTLADYVDWMLVHAGQSGKVKVAKIIKNHAIAKGVI
jgi:hypothetical protein